MGDCDELAAGRGKVFAGLYRRISLVWVDRPHPALVYPVLKRERTRAAFVHRSLIVQVPAPLEGVADGPAGCPVLEIMRKTVLLGLGWASCLDLGERQVVRAREVLRPHASGGVR